MSASLADSVEQIIYKKEQTVLDANQKQKLTSYIKDTLLPIFAGVPTYEGELLSICEYARQLADDFDKTSMLSVYTELASLLGNERNSVLCYEMTSLYLGYLRDDYRAKYEQTSYPWHLDDSEKCADMLNDLTELLGKENFAVAFDFSVLCLTLSSGLVMSEGEGNNSFKLNGSELNMLLRRHSMLLARKELSDAEWQAAFRIIEYIAQKKLHLASPLRNAVVSALADNSFLEGISPSINELIRLYESICLELSDEQCKTFIDGDRTETVRAICSALSSREEELSLFLASIEELSVSDESIGLSELKAIGYGEKYGEFLNEYSSASAESLISSVRDFAASESDDVTALRRAVISYIYGISPCLAFLVHCELQGENVTKGA